jgi:hypothetical protein
MRLLRNLNEKIYMKNNFISQLERQFIPDETCLSHTLTPTANVFCLMDAKSTGAVVPGHLPLVPIGVGPYENEGISIQSPRQQ